jgi:hypothetical protein
MFRYAFLRLFAEQRGIAWDYFDVRGYLKEIFPALLLGSGPSPKVSDWYFIKRSSEAAQLLEAGIWAWTGFFQDDFALDLLHSKRDRVLSWYTQPVAERARAKSFWSARKGACCVNVRGGDFLPRGAGMGSEWYVRAVDAARAELGSSVAFEAVTDDPAYARKVLGPDVRIHHESAAADFAMLTEAPALIQSNSTFCWWASYLNSSRLILSPTGRGKSWGPWQWSVRNIGWRLIA